MAPTNERGLFVPAQAGIGVPMRENAEQVRKGTRSRRLLLRWLGWGSLVTLLGQWSVGLLQFLRPGKVGAFGGPITAGAVSEFKVGDVKVVREGKFYLTRVPEGFLALWWKCPHLGCTIPWKENDPVMGGPPGPGDTAFAERGRFNCPCHASIYNRYGQVISGPATRPMDRFPVRIEQGKVVVDTGLNKVITRKVANSDDPVLP